MQDNNLCCDNLKFMADVTYNDLQMAHNHPIHQPSIIDKSTNHLINKLKLRCSTIMQVLNYGFPFLLNLRFYLRIQLH
jgi:hypothetical protein